MDMSHANHEHMNHEHMNHEHMNHMQMGHQMPVDHTVHNDSFLDNFAKEAAHTALRTDMASGMEGHAGHQGHNMDMGSGHDSHMGHSMSMAFHGGYDETILFSWWKVTEVGEFVGSFFAIFIMALLYESLKYYRKHLLWKTYTGLQYCAVSPPDKGVSNLCAPDEPQVQPMPHALERNVPTMLSGAHVWQTVLHGIQVLVSYMLMLVFMTYNVWLCLAVVLGSATGYYLFGWRESVVVDFTEHCH